MPIPIACPACGRVDTVPDRFAGQPASCPACRSPMYVPGIGLMPEQQNAPVAKSPVEPANHLPITLLAAACCSLVGLTVLLLIAFQFPWLTLTLGLSLAAFAVFALFSGWIAAVWHKLIPSSAGKMLAPHLCGVAAIAVGLAMVLLSTVSIIRHRQIETANRQAAALVEVARRQVSLGNLTDAEALLQQAVEIPRVKDDSGAASLLVEVRQAQAARFLQAAEDAIVRKEMREAISHLKSYVTHPNANSREDANKLLAVVELAAIPERALAALEAMSDDQFAVWSKTGELPSEFQCRSPVLAQACSEMLHTQRPEATRRREVTRLAKLEEERKQAETERLARLENERQVAERSKPKRRTIQLKDGSAVPLAITKAVDDRFSKLAAAGDEDGINQLILNDLVFLVPSGTEVLLIDGGLFRSEVRIKEGKHKGRSGWIPSEWLK